MTQGEFDFTGALLAVLAAGLFTAAMLNRLVLSGMTSLVPMYLELVKGRLSLDLLDRDEVVTGRDLDGHGGSRRIPGSTSQPAKHSRLQER
ncbi:MULTISPECIES: hypothetical protein [unclassified Methanoculleus]|jgi:hypothetical protein|uniref:Uncharacterized protein n=1 Tax=Methanoculleus formosensis TaxID=2590886 RepID=A0A9E4ZK59_9EURY|nr:MULTISPECIES: hypothetical protein [unclassified Methanoculleus]MCK9318404.1 hypothetical protein [Methanoculleus sp.]MCT8336639.1 hypothetical protein [Methanoculleus sp. Afa-1]MDD2254444.1 hypothetical protein [Methanoculleus sp.]MDD2786755.1 hypothetical protein [Methanoculleus sp.]MDD3216878.1 hypothetical protein [Methanoculleus sp.]